MSNDTLQAISSLMVSVHIREIFSDLVDSIEYYSGPGVEYNNDDTRYLCDWCFFDDEEILGKCEECGFILSDEKICDSRFCIIYHGDTEDIVEDGKDGYNQKFECPNCNNIITVRRNY